MGPLTRPYTGVKHVWSPEQISVWSGRATLAAQPAGTQPGDVEERVLCEYKGDPHPLMVEVDAEGPPLPVSPGDFTLGGRQGRLVWVSGNGRWISDVRSGIYQVPSTHFFRLSVLRYNRSSGPDPSASMRAAAAVLPGITAPSSEYVTSGSASVAAAGTATFDFGSSLYRYLQIAADAQVGDDTQARITQGVNTLLEMDYLVPFRFPAFPRIDLPGTANQFIFRNDSSANAISVTASAYA